MFKEVWFDLNGTLTIQTPEFLEAQDRLCYEAYAKATNQPLGATVESEFKRMYREHGSKSAVFAALGMPKSYWQEYFARLDESKYYRPDERIYPTVKRIREIVPISLLSNSAPTRVKSTLDSVNIDITWFTHVLTADDIKRPKPALEGFEKMVALAKAKPDEILFVGDRVDVDIIPAKKVGMKAALVWGESKEADYSFAEFEGLLKLFDGGAESK